MSRRLEKVRRLKSEEPEGKRPRVLGDFNGTSSGGLGSVTVYYDDSHIELGAVLMQDGRWLKYLKYYDITILYYPRKNNIVADAFSRKTESMGSLAYLPVAKRRLVMYFQALANQFMRLDMSEPTRIISCVVPQSSLLDHIMAHQFHDPHLLVLKEMVQCGSAQEVVIGDDGVMWLKGRICVPNIDVLRYFILEEAHNSHYSIHIGVMKMYHDLKQHYQWERMKKDIVAYVFRCLNCQ
ncbi:uncharacterized protein [Nicotiana tomentosiformis]|uniref:uncharacterized protein n=1 Tax=Nicotiana tomentosiformis TaxID=4098 RepID=UPI00388C68D6